MTFGAEVEDDFEREVSTIGANEMVEMVVEGVGVGKVG